jgi:DNA-binding NarL/FixJ family response regulator
MNSRKHFKKPAVRIVVVNSDPLRLVGLRALLESEPDFEFIDASISDLDRHNHIDIILLGSQRGQNLCDVAMLKAFHPDAQIIAIGSGMDDETILAALADGAKGYVDEATSGGELISAVRAVNRGSVWVSRKLLSLFVERASGVARRSSLDDSSAFTPREREVLEMLVDGRPNREIAEPLGIEVRTVKAHVANLMRKVGVRNRIALCVYAISHLLVAGQE